MTLNDVINMQLEAEDERRYLVLFEEDVDEVNDGEAKRIGVRQQDSMG